MLRWILPAFSILLSTVAAADGPLPSAGTVPQWTARLADQDVRVRWYATCALGQMGHDAAAAAPALMKVLADQYEHEYVRGGAAWALGAIRADGDEAVSLLSETLASKHVSVRRNAARALGRLGPSAAAAAPKLVPLLDDEESPVRVNAAEALWRIDRRPAAMEALVKMLGADGGPSACLAAVALGRLGSEAEAAVDPLVGALASPDGDVRRAAARSLGSIGPGALPALAKALESDNETVRRGAVESLGWIGQPDAALEKALTDSSPAVRMAAARALGGIGPKAAAAAPALIEATNDPDRGVRDEAAKALKRVRATAAPEGSAG